MRVCCVSKSRSRLHVPKRLHSSRDEGSKRRGTSVMVYFPTRKGEPRLERLHHYRLRSMAILLEADPDVSAWTAEPDDCSDATLDSFVPNFLVTRTTGRSALRVIRRKALTEAVLERYQLAARDLDERRIGLELHVEEQVEADPRLPVARDILRLRSWTVSDDLLARAAAISMRRTPRSLGAMHEALGGGDTWDGLLALVGHGHVDVGLPTELGPETAIRRFRLGAVA